MLACFTIYSVGVSAKSSEINITLDVLGQEKVISRVLNDLITTYNIMGNGRPIQVRPSFEKHPDTSTGRDT